ncbi:hypothetical protein M0811_01477 [Anaeramoeba ignava]|uniref:Fibronectin type-III domain-containing protein n=1 Tax=Anaeramoeba ignava TaxID=1746090 RepID=A0A9Q0R9U7_ANAIG|nr:hypothetical protein M0811_01477 [Anaeramoeba ignava]
MDCIRNDKSLKTKSLGMKPILLILFLINLIWIQSNPIQEISTETSLTKSDYSSLLDPSFEWVLEKVLNESASNFGYSVSNYGDVIVIGAYYVRKAFIYRYNGTNWNLEQLLQQSSSYFGYSVSIHEDVIVVGASYGNQAFIYRYNGTNWNLEQTFDGTSGSDFGWSVSNYENVVAVGAFRTNQTYIYRYNGTNWNTEQILNEDSNSFGYSVSVYEDVIVIGASYVRKAFIYRYNGTDWNLEQTLNETPANYGNSVSVYEDVIVVGAVYGSRAYIYRYNGTDWNNEQTLIGPSYFGQSVSIYKNVIVVGTCIINQTFIFEYNETNWNLEKTINGTVSYFGYSVSVYENIVVIGSWGDDESFIYQRIVIPRKPEINLINCSSLFSSFECYWNQPENNDSLHFQIDYGFDWNQIQYPYFDTSENIFYQEFNSSIYPSIYGNKKYSIQLQACNLTSEECGDPTSITNLTTRIDCVQNFTLNGLVNSINVSWQYPNVEIIEEIPHLDHYKLSYIGGNMNEPIFLNISNTSTYYEISGLEPESIYNVSIMGCRNDECENEDEGEIIYDTVQTDVEPSFEWVLEKVLNESASTFGWSVSNYGDVVVIGAYYARKAFIYRYNGTNWNLEQLLQQSTGYFGYSVSIHEDVIIIGAPAENKVFVYRYNGTIWNLEQTFDGISGSDFGWSVSNYENVVIVGAFRTNQTYIYRYNGTNWNIEQILYGPIYFGYTVSVYEDVIVVGSYYVGQVFIYRYNGTDWNLEQTFNGSIGNFGKSVSVYEDVIVVGNSGVQVFVYKYNGTNWNFEQILYGPSYFGRSVSIYKNVIAVGSYNINQAFIFIYNETNWNLEKTINGTSGSDFGYSVSVYENIVVIGSWRDDESFIYRRSIITPKPPFTNLINCSSLFSSFECYWNQPENNDSLHFQIDYGFDWNQIQYPYFDTSENIFYQEFNSSIYPSIYGNKQYSIQLQACNLTSEECGDPTSITNLTTRIDCVQNFTLNGLVNSINVSWQYPNVEIIEGIPHLDHYKLSYIGGSMSEPIFLNISNTSTYYEISGLEPESIYNVSIMGCRNDECENEDEGEIIYDQSQVRFGPVRDLECLVSNVLNISCSWLAPEGSYQPSYYNVTYQSQSFDDEQTYQTSSLYQNFIVSLPNQYYQINVSSCSSSGKCGNISTFIIKTDNLSAPIINQSNSKTEEIEIIFTKLNEAKSYLVSVDNKISWINFTTLIPNGNEMIGTINELAGNVYYYIAVRGCTELSCATQYLGDASEIITTKTKLGNITGFDCISTDCGFRCEWDELELSNGLRAYSLTYNSTSVCLYKSITNYSVSDLLQEEIYEISIFASADSNCLTNEYSGLSSITVITIENLTAPIIIESYSKPEEIELIFTKLNEAKSYLVSVDNKISWINFTTLIPNGNEMIGTINELAGNVDYNISVKGCTELSCASQYLGDASEIITTKAKLGSITGFNCNSTICGFECEWDELKLSDGLRGYSLTYNSTSVCLDNSITYFAVSNLLQEEIYLISIFASADWQCLTNEYSGLSSITAIMTEKMPYVWNVEEAFNEPSISGFGDSVSAYGNAFVVGASNEEKVFIYRYNGTNWNLEQALNEDSFENFGKSVSIYEDVLVVGASVLDEDSFENFGWSVSIYEDVLVVGAPSANQGFIYRYNGTNWNLEKVLDEDSYSFGISISVYEDVIVVGVAYGDKIFIYRYNGTNWNLEQTFDGVSSSYFGWSVSIYEDVFVVGAYLNSQVFIYRYNGTNWNLEQTLNGPPFENFGWSVSIYEDVLVVGAFSEDQSFIYRYNGTNWNTEEQPTNYLEANDPDPDSGQSVAVHENVLLVGSPYESELIVYQRIVIPRKPEINLINCSSLFSSFECYWDQPENNDSLHFQIDYGLGQTQIQYPYFDSSENIFYQEFNSSIYPSIYGNKQYSIYLQACNLTSEECGYSTPTTNLTTRIDCVQNFQLSEFANPIIVSWQHPNVEIIEEIPHLDHYKLSYIGGNMNEPVFLNISNTSTYYEISGLEPESIYNVSIMGCRNDECENEDEGEIVYEQSQVGLGPVRDLKCLVSNVLNISCSWLAPEGSYQPSYYNVTYQSQSFDDEQTYQTSSLYQNFIVSLPNQYYQINVSTCSSSGKCGDISSKTIRISDILHPNIIQSNSKTEAIELIFTKVNEAKSYLVSVDNHLSWINFTTLIPNGNEMIGIINELAGNVGYYISVRGCTELSCANQYLGDTSETITTKTKLGNITGFNCISTICGFECEWDELKLSDGLRGYSLTYNGKTFCMPKSITEYSVSNLLGGEIYEITIFASADWQCLTNDYSGLSSTTSITTLTPPTQGGSESSTTDTKVIVTVTVVPIILVGIVVIIFLWLRHKSKKRTREVEKNQNEEIELSNHL